jgi:hypothetical protein
MRPPVRVMFISKLHVKRSVVDATSGTKGGRIVYTLQRIYGAFDAVAILYVLVLVFAINGALLLALKGIKWAEVVRLFVLEHARRDAVGRRSQFAAAQLSHGGLTAGADDENLILAPFALLAGHGFVLVVDTVSLVCALQRARYLRGRVE